MIRSTLALLAILAMPGMAQQPVLPLPKMGGAACPLGYYASGSYCVPSTSTTKGAIEKSPGGSSCPLGFYSSGGYCVESQGSRRQQAIQKTGPCPLGWFSSGGYCLKSR